MSLALIERAFPVDPAALLPAVTPDNAPYWDCLATGALVLQRCEGCSRPRFPIAPVCPYCSHTAFGWAPLSGRGIVFSWIRYQRSYLPEFEDVMPYCVITAQLVEGVRMFGRLLDRIDPAEQLEIGEPVEAVIERWPGARSVPAFKRLK